MNTKEIIDFCKTYGVDVDRAQAHRWKKEYEGGGGTKSLVVMMRMMDEYYKSLPEIVRPELVDKGRKLGKVFVAKTAHDGYRPDIPVADDVPDKPGLIDYKPATPESFDGAKLKVSTVDEVGQSGEPGIIVRTAMAKEIVTPITDRVDEIEKEVHPTLMLSHATGLGNGWKYDRNRGKMCYVWDEVIYEGKKLEVGDQVNLDGDVVEIKEDGVLKSAW
jgi:hypothetical protein